MYPAAYQETLHAALEQAKVEGLFKEEHAIAGRPGRLGHPRRRPARP